MNNIDNCADCGKGFGFTERLFSKTNGLWICEDCAIKQIQENDNKDKRIADLEAKLAEKESEIKVGEFWHSAYQGKQLDYDKVYAELRQSYDENKKLKQQLAEKDKSFEWLHNKYAKHIETCNQDKISFAVEQLERALDIVENGLDDALKNISFNASYYNKILDKLDQLIAEIKGE